MSKPPPIELDGTRVDLGDDLLQTKKTIQRASTSVEESDRAIATPEGPDELVVNAKILRGEGLIEEAKHSLRRALILDPVHLPSKQLLENIHADEVRELLKGVATKKRSRLSNVRSPLDTLQTPDEILRKLEADLQMTTLVDEPFKDEVEKQLFLRQIDAHLSGESAENRIDLGIAFMEMGLFRLAKVQFEVAQREGELERKATLLLAQCYLAQGDPFQALLILDPWIADASHAPEEKLEVGYLMARAYEDLQRWEEAAIWFRGVTQIDSDYRDALERQQRCESIRSSSSR